MTEDVAKLNIETVDETLNLVLSGRLDIKAVAKLWTMAISSYRKYHPKKLIIDASAVDYCDSAGASLLLRLKELQLKNEGQFELVGLAKQFARLLNLIESVPSKADSLDEKPQSKHFLVKVGMATAVVLRLFYENLAYLGELCAECLHSIINPTVVRWKDVWRVIEATGPNALPIILLLGFLFGLIVAFQSAIPLQRFGAVIYIANLVGIALTRELAPLLVAIILAGRTASSFAAELGTMKVNQEIDALTTMGLRPLLFLIVPRILAVMLMSPILTVFMVIIGLFGAAVFMLMIGYSFHIFVTQVQSAVNMGDLFGGLFKSIVFGVMIAGIGCMHGLRTRFGASAVGVSTTQAVVSCIIMIVIVDGIFAVVFYALGL